MSVYLLLVDWILQLNYTKLISKIFFRPSLNNRVSIFYTKQFGKYNVHGKYLCSAKWSRASSIMCHKAVVTLGVNRNNTRYCRCTSNGASPEK